MSTVSTAGAIDREETPSPSPNQDHERSKRIDNAVLFLQDRRVGHAPITGKIQFLKSKGLSAEEMHEAFRKIGQVQSLDNIQKIMERLPSSVVLTSTATGSSRTLHSRSALGEAGYPAQQMHSQRFNTERLYPSESPFSHRANELAREWDWRDYVIGVGAAILSGFAAFKAFQFYSPYEIVRKSENRGDGVTSKSASSKRRNRMNAKHHNSDSEEGRQSLPPSLPTPGPNAQETKKKSDEEEMTRLHEELKQTQEALDKEKKSKAELSVTLGKLRAQTQRQSMSNDKQEMKISALQEEIDKLQKEAESRKSTQGDVSTEQPVSPVTVENTVPEATEIPSVNQTDVTALDAVVPVETPTSELPVLKASESSPEL